MKSILVPLMVLVTLSAARAQFDIVQPVRISGRSGPTLASTVVCGAADSGFKCDTCTSYLVCNGATQLGNNSCTSPNGFCDSTLNQCASSRPADCTEAGTNFICPSEGFFPDPTDCTISMFCDSTLKAEVYKCPDGYVYDALNGYCKRKVYTTDCVTMKCTTANVFIVHKTNPNFYAYCDSTLAPILFKCPDNMQFDLGCKYVCKKEGYHAGKDKTEAYLCTKSGVSWTVTIVNCPTDYEYNASFMCIKSV